MTWESKVREAWLERLDESGVYSYALNAALKVLVEELGLADLKGRVDKIETQLAVAADSMKNLYLDDKLEKRVEELENLLNRIVPHVDRLREGHVKNSKTGELWHFCPDSNSSTAQAEDQPSRPEPSFGGFWYCGSHAHAKPKIHHTIDEDDKPGIEIALCEVCGVAMLWIQPLEPADPPAEVKCDHPCHDAGMNRPIYKWWTDAHSSKPWRTAKHCPDCGAKIGG